jgi:hypothetical protein
MQATLSAVLRQLSKREERYQVEGIPAVTVSDHHPDRPAGQRPGESESSDDDKEGLRTAGMLLIRIS